MMKNLLESNRFLQKKLVLRLIFVLGLLITLYPLCSHLYYRYEADQEVQDSQRPADSRGAKSSRIG